jgi:hypothetical protein
VIFFPFFTPPDSYKNVKKSSGVNKLVKVVNSKHEKTATSYFQRVAVYGGGHGTRTPKAVSSNR